MLFQSLLTESLLRLTTLPVWLLLLRCAPLLDRRLGHHHHENAGAVSESPSRRGRTVREQEVSFPAVGISPWSFTGEPANICINFGSQTGVSSASRAQIMCGWPNQIMFRQQNRTEHRPGHCRLVISCALMWLCSNYVMASCGKFQGHNSRCWRSRRRLLCRMRIFPYIFVAVFELLTLPDLSVLKVVPKPSRSLSSAHLVHFSSSVQAFIICNIVLMKGHGKVLTHCSNTFHFSSILVYTLTLMNLQKSLGQEYTWHYTRGQLRLHLNLNYKTIRL